MVSIISLFVLQTFDAQNLGQDGIQLSCGYTHFHYWIAQRFYQIKNGHGAVHFILFV